MKLTLRVLAALLLAAPIAAAQTPDDVQLSISGIELTTHGADKPAGVTRGTGPLKIGQPTVAVFSVSGCGGFALTVPPHSFEENATFGWRVEMTPLKVVNHSVTFRLRWLRALDKGTGFEPATEDVEVTLKAGESRLIDSVPIVQSGLKTFDGKPCDTKAVSLRVSSDFPDFDRRLVGVELWLIERMPNGKEQTQSQSIRGLFNHAIPFYFDSVRDGTTRLDFFGKLMADPVQDGFDVSVEAIRAVPNPDQERGYQAARWFRSTVRIKPNEIVDVALPPPDDKSAPLADRAFSIRIRARQIR
jgi:hypothetical protein